MNLLSNHSAIFVDKQDTLLLSVSIGLIFSTEILIPLLVFLLVPLPWSHFVRFHSPLIHFIPLVRLLLQHQVFLPMIPTMELHTTLHPMSLPLTLRLLIMAPTNLLSAMAQLYLLHTSVILTSLHLDHYNSKISY